MEQSQAYDEARKRVAARMGFYTHFTVYAAVILFLAILNFATSPSVFWFQWPMIGWGFAVLLHAAAVFLFPRHFAVTEGMVEKEMARTRRVS